MLKGYKKQAVIDTPSQYCTIYKCTKNAKPYLLYQFDQLNQSDQFSFKIIKKLTKLKDYILQIQEEFEEKQSHYFVMEYVEMDLLKLLLSRPQHVFDLVIALEYFARIIEVIELFHENKLIYRNIRPELIKINSLTNKPCFFDFSMSQFIRRQERMYEVVGCQSFLAPQFFSDDGYGPEVDIWGCGVLFYYMLVNEYPFKFKSNEEAIMKEEFLVKCDPKGEGFKFFQQLEKTKHNSHPLKGNKLLDDFFKKIFTIDPNKRITIQEIKRHKLFESHFENVQQETTLDKEMLEAIQEGGRQESLLLSRIYKHPCSDEFYKEEVILDFIEHSAEEFVLECSQIYSEDLRYRVQFSILKIGLIKCNFLIDLFYGKKHPKFQKVEITQEEWQKVRNRKEIMLLKEKIEKKKKIIYMLFKNASMNVKMSPQDALFSQNIPETFDQIKIAYRNTLSEMFEMGRQNLMKAKSDRKLSRKLTQNLVRVIIFFLVNRLFQSEKSMKDDFKLYYAWSKKKDLSDLQVWIEAENILNLKSFMKTVTTNYL